jgi:hypothetical protein
MPVLGVVTCATSAPTFSPDDETLNVSALQQALSVVLSSLGEHLTVAAVGQGVSQVDTTSEGSSTCKLRCGCRPAERQIAVRHLHSLTTTLAPNPKPSFSSSSTLTISRSFPGLPSLPLCRHLPSPCKGYGPLVNR